MLIQLMSLQQVEQFLKLQMAVHIGQLKVVVIQIILFLQISRRTTPVTYQVLMGLLLKLQMGEIIGLVKQHLLHMNFIRFILLII